MKIKINFCAFIFLILSIALFFVVTSSRGIVKLTTNLLNVHTLNSVLGKRVFLVEMLSFYV